ncbi:MAG TPA: hypothetical protein VK735_44965 [Pseudonocardia sp.]|uniref:hypothetical protein n=1 Tax=Pseudonocardia sp. TaxID=60912 RepID=UPI002BDE0390|nr:hypothetical protein [Pseudonocardia sp.]HTF54639.1 hypothetical protein [Pseudonocardia sp.]
MRSPFASAACGAVLIAGAALGASPTPVAHATTLPSLSVELCAAAKLNLGQVTDDLDNALNALDVLGVVATAGELTRRLGLTDLLGTESATNDDVLAKIRAVLTLKAAKVLADDRVSEACGDDTIIVVPPTTSSSSAAPKPSTQVPYRPRRAPETGDGSSASAAAPGAVRGTDALNPHLADSIAPAMALYALLSVGSIATAVAVHRWTREA